MPCEDSIIPGLLNNGYEYLNSVERKFSRDSGGAEVIQDLESRMAELFTEKLKPHKESISHQDVREVLEVLGGPSDMGGSEKGNRNDYKSARSDIDKK